MNETTLHPETLRAVYPYGVGIDCHSKFIQTCVLIANGSEILQYEEEFQCLWPNLIAAKKWILEVIGKHGLSVGEDAPLRFTLESTGCYHIPVIRALDGVPSVVNPLLASPSRRKTDVLDARLLAYHALTGLWPASFIATELTEQLRVLMKLRSQCTRTLTRALNRICNYMLRFGHTYHVTKALQTPAGYAITIELCNGSVPNDDGVCPKGLPEHMRKPVLELLDESAVQKAMAASYLKQFYDLAKEMTDITEDGIVLNGTDIISLLSTVPGLGPVGRASWLAEAVTWTRFPSAKACSAFAGFDPSLKVSAGHVTQQARRKGNTTLHDAILKSAGSLITRRSEPLGKWGFALYKRAIKGGWKKACSAVGRRMIVGIWNMLRTGKEWSLDGYHFYDTPEFPPVPLDTLLKPVFVRTLLKHNIATLQEAGQAYYDGRLADLKGVGDQCLKQLSAVLKTASLSKEP